MICTELESDVLGMGCDMMQMARTTCPTAVTLSLKYDGSPITSGALATAPSSSFTPTNLPSSPNWTSRFSLLSMYVPPWTAASRAKPCMHAEGGAVAGIMREGWWGAGGGGTPAQGTLGVDASPGTPRFRMQAGKVAVAASGAPRGGHAGAPQLASGLQSRHKGTRPVRASGLVSQAPDHTRAFAALAVSRVCLCS